MLGLIRYKFTLLVAAILLAAGSTTFAQEPLLVPPGVEILTLDKAIDQALVNNRSAQNARLETEKNNERTAAALSLIHI